MGGLAQKVKNLFVKQEELLPIQDDNNYHSQIQNQQYEFDKNSSGNFNQMESQNQNLNDGKLYSMSSMLKVLDKYRSCPVRMLTMMQGKQYDTQLYQNEQKKIEEIITKLN
ncbi:unnamed protein product [Paramecium primaurelia]|uniref:Uncharacterized protein n=1 Tax=Paramecium primaurelia TaxID=5886 RepID=A0A8S1MGM7_PARPR|nr:unnamed protein product [Paramecium primaurelia]